jgi:hypothetical protein
MMNVMMNNPNILAVENRRLWNFSKFGNSMDDGRLIEIRYKLFFGMKRLLKVDVQ